MAIRVKLPPGPLIAHQALCEAMAEAVCPTRPEYFRGIECVVGKIVRCLIPMSRPTDGEQWSVPALQSVLLSDDGRALDQLAQEPGRAHDPVNSESSSYDQQRSNLVELPLPYALDASDRNALSEILPLLPALSYPISQADEAAFLEAYISLKGRPVWEPILVTDSWMSRRKNEQMTVFERHQQALAEEHRQGRLRAVDAQHVPVPALSWASFIPRQKAITYLEECGYTPDESTRQTCLANRPLPEVVPAMFDERAMIPAVADAKELTGAASATETLGAGRPRQAHVMDGATKHLAGDLLESEGGRRVGKVLRLRQVEQMTGLKRSSIYYRMDPRSRYYDPTFPRCFSLSTTESGAVGWDEEQVNAWVAVQVAAGRK
ncbi:conserved hypothetical protein [Ricinus communis]|uniref:Uncharacterized protein n=1 Tax=Ricinus communis TaxID=3988 RepID=B9THH9_RICCO|nr:conserved hypothetical protein [Ricinus communis]